VNAQTIAHARAAVLLGQPRVLHWHPELADANRAASLRGIKTWGQLTAEQRAALDPDHPDVLHDRDEYPPAATLEGGTGADVRYILSADNRSAGSRMKAQLTAFCADTRFILEP
jgi:hypothetical protein